jgi:NodT family efflux transporter outer membrane factor (OMF) lipoprotein
MKPINRVASLFTIAALASLAACSVGPDYKGPPDAAPIAGRAAAFHRAATADAIAAAPPARWWEALGDPMLTRLIDTALRDGLTVEQEVARLRNARASVAEQRSAFFPRGGADALAVRTQIPTGSLSSLTGAGGATSAGSSGYTTNLFDAGFDATWEIDIFGGTRRAVQGARAQAAAQEATLADAQVQLAAEMAQDYVNLRDAQIRLHLLQSSSLLEQRTLDLTRQRRALGTASESDVDRLETQLQQTAAEAPTLQAQIEQYLDQIATLAGVEPGELDVSLSAAGTLPVPPATIAVGDPATMLRRRPDIRRAERQLAADTAQIGQDVAQYFPSVTLLGTIGFAGTDAGHLFSGNNLNALGGPSLSWNIFNFPRTMARVSEAEASRDAAVAQYRNTVLSALRDANTSLSRYGHQRENVERLRAADAAAQRAAGLGRQREQEGTASLIDVLDIERQRLQTEQDLAQAQANLTNDYVALQKALGLGWDVRSDSAQSGETKKQRQALLF